MREIKFRAWNGEKMRVVKLIDFLSQQVAFDASLDPESESWRFYGDKDIEVPLMQYTGLKDKNGKEIYEGDILIRVIGENKGNPVYDYKGSVQYHKERATFVFCDGYNELLFEKMPDLQVIGSIYENPELLED